MAALKIFIAIFLFLYIASMAHEQVQAITYMYPDEAQGMINPVIRKAKTEKKRIAREKALERALEHKKAALERKKAARSTTEIKINQPEVSGEEE